MTQFEQDFMAQAIRTAEAMREKHNLDDAIPDYHREEEKAIAAIDAFYMAIPSPANPPLAVRRAIVLKFADKLDQAYAALARLSYDGLNGCYGFGWAGMYVGVETDGYLHT